MTPLSYVAGLITLLIAIIFRLSSNYLSVSLANTKAFCYEGVRTQNDLAPAAECFTVFNGTFASVFNISNAGASEGQMDFPRLSGYAIPGLWDGHGHLLHYGEILHSVDLFGTRSVDDVCQRVRRFLKKASPTAGTAVDWILGMGWDEQNLDESPTSSVNSEKQVFERDTRLKGLYIMLERVDVHCIWVSEAVMNLLSKASLNNTWHAQEAPRGVLCNEAMEAVVSLLPKASAARKREYIRTAMSKLHEVGIVGIHDAGVLPNDLQLYNDMLSNNHWTLRVYAMVKCAKRNTFCIDSIPKVSENDGFFAIRSAKLWADGALGSRGAALIDPYNDRPDTSGFLHLSEFELTSVTRAWATAGYQVNIHAIGDLANRVAVNSIHAVLTDLCNGKELDQQHANLTSCQLSRYRFRIEHAQILHPEEQRRILSLGIIPSIQPTHATSDMSFARHRLGQSRMLSEAHRLRSLLGAHPVLGSDFPVEEPNPFQGIYAAITRRNPHTGEGERGDNAGWLPEESLSLSDALNGFTTNVARGGFMEGLAGAIQVGAYADWVVLDKPLDGYVVDDFRSLRVKETWVGGKKVYSRDNDRETILNSIL